ncbi:sigma-70 family RNA polymerase sigma factor [Phycicoccus sonneratiae]|uniref:Sigma-70 family RNA polymerase sigma factor n=1 Tax=Phycicoccus sonneratiae TaxID=2807628 RepID=A0ABS2CPI0_9MICO|nr:sigma-70 family RNA polymerase sigma factor [Phycicoccus sonneraticus]MBM6401745.1 sigma-70 family RNA polymerase sigma factor [Phycicoccus sonneraticus]
MSPHRPTSIRPLAAPTRPSGATADLEELLAAYERAAAPADRERLLADVVTATLPLADSLALRYTGRGIDTDDLLQVARTALVTAVLRYRPGAGRGFEAFAVPTVRGELKRHFRDAGWVVRPPRGLQELRAELVPAEDDLRQQLGRDATLAELARAVGRDLADVAEARATASAFTPSSLDAPSPAGGTAGDRLADPLDATDGVLLRAAVRAEVARLTPRERVIIRLRFVEERTQSEIGEAIGVSQMQVSRLLAGLLDRLRERLDALAAA